MADLEEMPHIRVHDHFKVLQYLLIEQIFKLLFIAFLIKAILRLLPKLVRDVVLSEALTVVDQDLEQIFDRESKPAFFSMILTNPTFYPFCLITRVACNRYGSLLFWQHYSLIQIHFVVSEGMAFVTNNHFVADHLHTELNPLDYINRLKWIICHYQDVVFRKSLL